jgi:adenylate kinase family enzyme
MKRVAVIGCSGAGKTALAHRLGDILGLPVLHIDDVYWQPDGAGRVVEPSAEQWKRRHEEMIARPSWVIDGLKLGVLPERLAVADLVVFLDVPTRVCLAGVLLRRLGHRGGMRSDIGVHDRVSWELLRWVASFRRVQRRKVMARLDACSARVVVLRSWRDAQRWLAALERARTTRS